MSTSHGKEFVEIRIVEEFEVAKVIAFARAGVRMVRFRMAAEMVDPLLKAAEEFARVRDLRIRVDMVETTGTKVLLYGVSGAVAGAGIGFAVGGPTGAVIGAVAGGVAGVALANIRITITASDGGTDLCVSLA